MPLGLLALSLLQSPCEGEGNRSAIAPHTWCPLPMWIGPSLWLVCARFFRPSHTLRPPIAACLHRPGDYPVSAGPGRNWHSVARFFDSGSFQRPAAPWSPRIPAGRATWCGEVWLDRRAWPGRNLHSDWPARKSRLGGVFLWRRRVRLPGPEKSGKRPATDQGVRLFPSIGAGAEWHPLPARSFFERRECFSLFWWRATHPIVRLYLRKKPHKNGHFRHKLLRKLSIPCGQQLCDKAGDLLQECRTVASNRTILLVSY